MSLLRGQPAECGVHPGEGAAVARRIRRGALSVISGGIPLANCVDVNRFVVTGSIVSIVDRVVLFGSALSAARPQAWGEFVENRVLCCAGPRGVGISETLEGRGELG
ncbi:hypothetical protein [Saccharopolyspora pogona]|uniref:hypothetical protein n=1 Tax=Saccharopolyspora pogona TaxID=333966 RepID=UPI0016846B75|nr:hypothetical protein [Saccharopolyspora pogona]